MNRNSYIAETISLERESWPDDKLLALPMSTVPTATDFRPDLLYEQFPQGPSRNTLTPSQDGNYSAGVRPGVLGLLN